MNRFRIAAFLGALLLASAAVQAQAPTTVSGRLNEIVPGSSRPDCELPAPGIS